MMIRRFGKERFSDRIKLSYDPDDVNIRLQHFRISDIIKMIDKESLDILQDDFEYLNTIAEIEPNEEDLDIETEDEIQRMPRLWNDVSKSLFIESLMIRLPIPLFYFDGSERPWRVIDGLQRLHTIMEFINGKFALTSLEYLKKECEGKYFRDSKLPGYLKSRILDAEVVAYVINPGTPRDVKYNIFKRINTGGLRLNGQEIRNAFFRGAPANLTKDLAKEPIFQKATNGKVPSRRMVDREYANRFLAFQLFGYEDYNGKMDQFLSEAMMCLYEEENKFSELRLSFERSMHRCFQLLGGYSFYRPKEEGWGRQPNKAVFDTMSWNLNVLPESKYANIIYRKNDFEVEYRKFMQTDERIFRAVNDTTGAKNAVNNRFSLLQQFLNNF